MEIRALRLVVTEADVNLFVQRFSKDDGKMRGVGVQLLPEGMRVTGVYSTIVTIPFEGLWKISTRDGKIIARLASLKTGGLEAGLLKPALLKFITAKTCALSSTEDSLWLDLDRLLEEKGIPLRINLTAIHCGPGTLVIEGGVPAIGA